MVRLLVSTIDQLLTDMLSAATLESNVADILSVTKLSIPSPTILFIKAAHLQSLSSSVTTEAKKSHFLYSFAHRHKLAGMAEGFITNDSLWDRMVFHAARLAALGDCANSIRTVIVSGSESCPDII
jgi:long-chain acyl-CoA synthetase